MNSNGPDAAAPDPVTSAWDPHAERAPLTLGDVLADPTAHPFGTALYGPPGDHLDLATPVIVHDVDDVEDDSDDPAIVLKAGYRYLLDLQTVASIIDNARQQRPNLTPDDRLDAFAHYLARDAFIVW